MSGFSNLRRAREKKGLSQKYIAASLGVSAPTVSEWESGRKTPTVENLIRLSDLIGASVDYLLGREEKTVPADCGEDVKSVFPEVFIKAYQELNDEGREKVIEYATDLAASGRYRKKADKHEMGSAAG